MVLPPEGPRLVGTWTACRSALGRYFFHDPSEHRRSLDTSTCCDDPRSRGLNLGPVLPRLSRRGLPFARNTARVRPNDAPRRTARGSPSPRHKITRASPQQITDDRRKTFAGGSPSTHWRASLHDASPFRITPLGVASPGRDISLLVNRLSSRLPLVPRGRVCKTGLAGDSSRAGVVVDLSRTSAAS